MKFDDYRAHDVLGVATLVRKREVPRAEVVARLRGAGFLILGRTSSLEFGMDFSIEPVANGSARNP